MLESFYLDSGDLKKKIKYIIGIIYNICKIINKCF